MAKFEELKARTTIEAVAALVGLSTTAREGDPKQLRATCPKCQRGKKDVSISIDKQKFTCWSSKAHGDVIDFFAHVRGYDSNQEAGEALKKLLDSPPETQEPGQPKNPANLQKILEYLVSSVELIKDPEKAKGFRELGVSKETCQHFQAGYAPQGTMAGRFLIPLHSPSGELVGFVGVSIDGREPFFKYPENIVRGNLIFNIHRVREASEVIIAPDPLMVLIGYENGDPDIISYLDT